MTDRALQTLPLDGPTADERVPDPVPRGHAGHEPSSPTAPERLLEGLDPGQREAVVTTASPLAILAGPGSGKTRVLTHRIAWQASTGALAAQHVLAVTFTRKAAGELTRRLRLLGVRGVTAGTLHSVALAQLQAHAASQGRSAPALVDHKVRMLAGLIGGGRAEAWALAPDLAREIEWAKASLVDPGQYPSAAVRSGRETPRPPAEVAELYGRYQHTLRRRGVLDFEDLLARCADVMESDTTFGAAQRWRLRHLFVDEFQDVSPLQLRLLRAWLGDRDDLCVVGDPDQAIFGFAGADAGHLRGFARLFPGARTVRLDRNYRSTPEIVSAAERLLRDADPDRRPRTAVRPTGPVPTVTAYDSDEAEAEGVVALLPRVRAEHGTWSAAAILYRTNAQSARFEERLGAAGIPFRVVGDGRFLDRPEVKAAIASLQRSERAGGGRGEADLDSRLAALEQEAATLPEERRQHVATLVRLGEDYLSISTGTASVAGFLAHLSATLTREAPEQERDAVQLLSFHRAKGLEFPVVFVTGLERGLVPISHADTPTARAEERRLLYVALSRAERELHLSYAQQRTLGTRRVPRVPSPWLAVISDQAASRQPDRPSRRAASGIAAVRTTLARSSPPADDDADPELLAALVEWRKNLARASGVPAYVIFHDSTLRAVASTKPTRRTALLELPGIGPIKVERHGEAVLELVRRHAS